MSGQLRVDEVTNKAGTGSPSFPNGVDATELVGDIAADRMKDGFNASGSAPVYACRAWVNFDGTGTVSIRASGNVSSITDNGTGNYTVNFTTAMPDANYSVVGLNQFSQDNTINNNSGMGIRRTSNALLTGSVTVMTGLNDTATQADSTTVCVSIFR